MESNKEQQELVFKLSMFEQQINSINQQLQAVEKAIIDMNELDLGLNEIKGKKDKEILASIGKGIFAKAKLISDELIVDIGGGNLVNKSIEDTQGIIKKQIKKLGEAKAELNKAQEDVNKQLSEVMKEYQEKASKSQ